MLGNKVTNVKYLDIYLTFITCRNIYSSGISHKCLQSYFCTVENLINKININFMFLNKNHDSIVFFWIPSASFQGILYTENAPTSLFLFPAKMADFLRRNAGGLTCKIKLVITKVEAAWNKQCLCNWYFPSFMIYLLLENQIQTFSRLIFFGHNLPCIWIKTFV